MTGLEIALIVFGIIIFIGIIIVIILVAVGVFETKQISKILSGTFSLHPLNDSSKHLTTSSVVANKTPAEKDTLVLSSSSTIKCEDYGWVFKDNFLELGTTGLVAVATDPVTSGTEITLAKKAAASKTNQWEYNDAGLTWCLKSDNSFCMFDKADKITLERRSINTGFSWVPVDGLVPPACT